MATRLLLRALLRFLRLSRDVALREEAVVLGELEFHNGDAL